MRYLKRKISDSWHWFFDDKHFVWHPVTLLHLNADETKCYVELRKYDSIYNYFEQSRFWVDKGDIDAWEYDPNVDLATSTTYIKSIHPFTWYVELKYYIDDQFFSTEFNNNTSGMVQFYDSFNVINCFLNLFFEVFLYKHKKSSIDLDVSFNVMHPYYTENFYGDSLSNWILEINEVSDPEHPKLLSSTVLETGQLQSEGMELKLGGEIYLWTVRREEDLKSSRDYEVILDVHSYVDSSGILKATLPQQVKKIIGNYCTPIIGSGYIVFKT